MDLTGLTALQAVADKKSFTAAASELGVTPSAISQSIKALEQRAGVRLVQRTTRSVGLTEAGARFVEKLRPALVEIDAAFRALDEHRDRPMGVLRLNVPRVACAYLLEPILADFLKEHPAIDLDIAIEDRFADIVDRGYDAGIRLGETLDQEMVAVPISEPESAAIVGSPAYFKTHKRPKHPRELHEHECICYRQITSGQLYRWELSDGDKELEIAVRGRITTNDAQLMLSAALAGLGLAYLLAGTVKTELAEKKLVRVLEPFCPDFPGFFLYYPSRAQVPLKLKALIDFLKKRKKRRAT